MGAERLLGTVAAISKFEGKLATCREVARFSTKENNEPAALAYALSELEESFRRFLDEQLPAVVQGDHPPEGLYNHLLDIGEELRHILYHVSDTQFYKYLQPE